jgi:hypothetical protein
MLNAFGIKHIQIPPHSPWSNGRAERMVRTVKSCIRKVIHNSKFKDWRKLVPWIANAINSSSCKSTGFTPMEMFLGTIGRPLALVN